MGFSKTSIVSTAAKPGINLEGQGVLITRPKAQAAGLEKRVLKNGGLPYVFPTLEINYTPTVILSPQLMQVQNGQILIFISANAVKGVFQDISSKLRQQISSAQIAAVGKRTQAALDAENMQVSIVPDTLQQNTEGLLSHPALQKLNGQHITIVRAQAGREVLRDTLQSRGASVEYIQAYVRVIPQQYDAAKILSAFEANKIELVLLSSYEAYTNLTKMLGDQLDKHLIGTRIVVPSKRIAEKIRKNKAMNLVVADDASDEAMLVAGSQ